VLVAANGRLGVATSSARYKHDIRNMGEASRKLLKLRAVSFRYNNDPTNTVQYGLVVEEGAKVYPELAVNGPDGKVMRVRYQELIPMLLNQAQRQAAQIQQLTERRAQQAERMEQQTERIQHLTKQGGQQAAQNRRLAVVRARRAAGGAGDAVERHVRAGAGRAEGNPQPRSSSLQQVSTKLIGPGRGRAGAARDTDRRSVGAVTNGLRPWQRAFRLLPILCGTVARLVGFLFANKGAIVSVPVSSLALEVINAAGRIEPDDGILRAVVLSLMLGPIASQKACRTACRTACRNARLPIGQCGTSAKEGKRESENEQRPGKVSANLTPHTESLLCGIFQGLIRTIRKGRVCRFKD
jgi:hypothetical protein